MAILRPSPATKHSRQTGAACPPSKPPRPRPDRGALHVFSPELWGRPRRCLGPGRAGGDQEHAFAARRGQSRSAAGATMRGKDAVP